MKPPGPEYSPVYGKTYSLFGKSDSTSEYYKTIRMLADKIHALAPDIRDLIYNFRLIAHVVYPAMLPPKRR